MIHRKYPEADVDRRSGFYFLIGLAVALLMVLVAFQYAYNPQSDFNIESNIIIEEDEEIPDVTKQKELPPPPKIPPKVKVVEDEEEIEEDQPEIEDVEIEETDTVAIDEPEEEPVQEEQIFIVVEESPEFPGGLAKMYEFIQKNIRYPRMEKEAGIQGRVIVTFVVEKDGSITDVQVLKGVTEGLNNEAMRVVKAMPRWKPGKQRGRPVRVRVNLPINFILR